MSNDGSISFVIIKKNFVKAIDGQHCGTWCATVNSIDDLKTQLWEKISHHLMREIIMVKKQPTWASKSDLNIHEIGKFIKIDDKNCGFHPFCKSKRSLTNANLMQWKDTTRKIYVFPYSTNLKKEKHYNKARSMIEQAESNRNLTANLTKMDKIVTQMKANYEKHCTQESSWRKWAFLIVNKDKRLYEILKSTPPDMLNQLFTDYDPNQPLPEQDSNIVVRRRTEGVKEEVAAIQGSFYHVKSELSKAINGLEMHLSVLKSKVGDEGTAGHQ